MFTIRGQHNGRTVAVRWEAGELTCDDGGLLALLRFADQHHIEVCATPNGPCWPADLRLDYVALVMVMQALERLETASGDLPDVPAIQAMMRAARDQPAGAGAPAATVGAHTTNTTEPGHDDQTPHLNRRRNSGMVWPPEGQAAP